MKFYSEIWSILKKKIIKNIQILQGFETGVYVNKFVFEIACQSICIYTLILCTFFATIGVIFRKISMKINFLKKRKKKINIILFEINVYKFFIDFIIYRNPVISNNFR